MLGFVPYWYRELICASHLVDENRSGDDLGPDVVAQFVGLLRHFNNAFTRGMATQFHFEWFSQIFLPTIVAFICVYTVFMINRRCHTALEKCSLTTSIGSS